MGLLSGTKVYLAGAIEYATDGKGGVIWRDEVTPKLEAMGIRVYNPMRKPTWYPDLAKANPSVYIKKVMDIANAGAADASATQDAFNAIKFIERADFRYIYDCEWVLAYVPRVFSVGTIDELRVAADAKKPILIVCPDLIPSSWMLGMLSSADDWKEVFHRTMDDALAYLGAVDRGEVELDPLKWIFLSYFKSVPLKKVSP